MRTPFLPSLAGALLLVLAPPPRAAAQAAPPIDLRILAINDFHGYLNPPPDGIRIAVLRSEDSSEFRTEADEATQAKPGYPECVAMMVQIGDHLSKQFDVKA